MRLSNDQLIKDTREFQKLIEYLGYTVDACSYSWCHIVIDDRYSAMIMSDFYLYRTPRDVIDMIEQHIGRHHVACKQCHTVLLQDDREPILTTVASILKEDHPELSRVCEVRRKQPIEYRATTDGPNSEHITSCPKCGNALDEDSVREIAE